MAAAAGEVVVVMSGDGLIGQVGGALANTGATFGILPGRARQRPRAGARDPARDRGGRRGAGRRARSARSTSARSTASASSASRAAASTPTPTASRTRRSGCAARPSTSTRRCGRWRSGSRPASALTLDGEQAEFTGYSVRGGNGPAYGGGMYAAPGAELDDGLLDVVWVNQMRQAPGSSPACRKVFKGTHVEHAERHRPARTRRCGSRPTGHSPSTPTATTWPTSPPR